ncbi:lipase 3 [Stomoxys calcitrans]|uniref:Lipase n=1 Tax=Stomoxys calcitrans TaxID=35570 RepID=A0A1I8PH64_STOCA|nr:lipase 3 [Stomoxys calcitrans]
MGLNYNFKKMHLLLALAVILVALLAINPNTLALTTTCDRITQHGYPCENHVVTTSDGYLLTMFRIPNSHRMESRKVDSRPAVLLMHGTQSSSDMWVLNGPNDGLPFMLADGGFDVWLGNVRGNIYSRNHTTLSPSSSEFRDYSWDEIGQRDMPAKIDYILKHTGDKSLHYIGFSQGTRIFMILLSSKPEYSAKIRSSHMLGPGVFLCHVRSLLPTLLAPFLGRPSALATLYGSISTNAFGELINTVGPGLCRQSSFVPLCINALQSTAGRGSPYINKTVLPEFFATNPAGSSPRLSLHFFQLTASCKFQAFDFGPEENMRRYGQSFPPPYELENIKLQTPAELYFSENDYLATVKDVQHLSQIMGDQVIPHRVNLTKYNHFDFILAENVKTVVNDCVLDKMQKYEGRPFNGSLCNYFIDKPFDEK